MQSLRGNIVAFRVTNQERRALKILAQRENRRVSEYLRQLIRQAAERQGLPPIALVGILPAGGSDDLQRNS